MKYITMLLFLLMTLPLWAQSKNFIDQPYIETQATIDTLIVPDEIYISIVLDEDDNRNRKSTEDLENAMLLVLKSLNINTEKNLSLLDFSSDFKKYFLSNQKVVKTKMFSLKVGDALTAGKVLAGLERQEISNVSISKTSYSKSKELLLQLKSKAILKAKENAVSMVSPLNQNVGKAIFISDVASISNTLQGKAAGIQIRGASSIYGSRASAPIVVDFEKIKFSSSVNAKFIIE